MNNVKKKVLEGTSKIAKDTANSIFGQLCRTWFYQPKVPQKILDLDK